MLATGREATNLLSQTLLGCTEPGLVLASRTEVPMICGIDLLALQGSDTKTYETSTSFKAREQFIDH